MSNKRVPARFVTFQLWSMLLAERLCIWLCCELLQLVYVFGCDVFGAHMCCQLMKMFS